MSFSRLYDAVQAMDGRISVRCLRDEAIRLSSITVVREQWTGIIDPAAMRGFYIEGPLGGPVPLAENEALIVLARSLDPSQRRLVYAKELMHIFDSPDEKTDSPQKFDAQVERLTDPTASVTDQFRAEKKALWRAITLFCQERRRLEYQRSLAASETSIDVVAAALRIPASYARHLFRPDYLKILSKLK